MITVERLKEILAQGESTEVEFKRSRDSLARSVYESICAFLNRRGGHIVLGVNDDGTIEGINPGVVQQQLDTLAKDLNNPQIFSPTTYVAFDKIEIEGKWLIYGYVPISTQGHSYNGKFFDRNQDGDFELRSSSQKANLFIRKGAIHTEEIIFPYITLNDLDESAFHKLRALVSIKKQQSSLDYSQQ